MTKLDPETAAKLTKVLHATTDMIEADLQPLGQLFPDLRWVMAIEFDGGGGQTVLSGKPVTTVAAQAELLERAVAFLDDLPPLKRPQ